MCGCFFIEFIDFMLKGKSLLDCKNFFSPDDHEKHKIFQWLKRFKKLCCINWSKYEKFGKHKISYLLEKTLVLSIICSKYKNKGEKLFKEEESIEISKILSLIKNI